jgi:signal transduction histidine kinase
MVARIAPSTRQHQVVFHAAAPVIVNADRLRLQQVIGNLLDNSIKYSPAGGRIESTVAIQDGSAVVSISDRGIGIPSGRQERIFQRFYRAHTGTPHDYGGMGVGLYISREIVMRHGGQIWFTSEESRGSTFSFSLPLDSSELGSSEWGPDVR